jgi:hypothetical protein
MPDRSERPARNTLPAISVREFRHLLDTALADRDDHGRRWSDARWGCYAFYDYDGEPIYVGQTNERLRTRVRRHLTNQRTDGLRRVLVIQAVRLAYISAVRLALVEGRQAPEPAAIDITGLVGSVLAEYSDPLGRTDEDEIADADG